MGARRRLGDALDRRHDGGDPRSRQPPRPRSRPAGQQAPERERRHLPGRGNPRHCLRRHAGAVPLSADRHDPLSPADDPRRYLRRRPRARQSRAVRPACLRQRSPHRDLSGGQPDGAGRARTLPLRHLLSVPRPRPAGDAGRHLGRPAVEPPRLAQEGRPRRHRVPARDRDRPRQGGLHAPPRGGHRNRQRPADRRVLRPAP